MATITKRQSKSGPVYRIRVSNGYDVTGRQISESLTWKPPIGISEKAAIKEAARQAVLFEEKVRSDLVLDGDKITLAEFIDRWMKNYAAVQLAPATISLYEDELLPRIKTAIGHIKIGKLQPHHLIDFYQNLAEAGINQGTKKAVAIVDLKVPIQAKEMKRIEIANTAGICDRTLYEAIRGKKINLASAEAIAGILGGQTTDFFKVIGDNEPLSATSIKRYHGCISSILQTAMHWQIIPDNPARRVKPPKAEKKEAKYLDYDQYMQVVVVLKQEPIKWRTMLLLALYTGMRRGELCGLEWRDIDFDNQMIYVHRSTQYNKKLGGIITKAPKNSTSHRPMKLPEEVFSLLHTYKAWQNGERLALGDRWPSTLNIINEKGVTTKQKNDRVFAAEEGGLIFPDSLTSWTHAFRLRHNLPEFTPHTMRHTNISMMIAAGVPLRTVSGRAGHAQTSTTLNIYAHVIQATDELAAEAIGDLLQLRKKDLFNNK